MKKKRKWDKFPNAWGSNFLLKMKLLTLLICLAMASVAADSYSQQTKFNINANNITLKDIFRQIERESDFIFVYSENNVDLQRKVNSTYKNESLNKILDEIFAGTNNYYEVHDRQIVILSKPAEATIPTELRQDAHTVKGTVTDQSGLPIPGVNIWIKGTNLGTITDVNGKYEIKGRLLPETFLEFSFIGLKTQKIQVGSREIIDVKMETEEISIADITVKGAYGTVQKKSDMVGSAYQVNAEQIKSRPATRVDLLLDGIVPGLKIEPNTDSPATTRTRYNTRIRGAASLSASNEPLWIIDGTPIYTGGKTNLVAGVQTSVSPLAGINPEDIESITVLKDASATSIYGANGANGVILVTTKKGVRDLPPQLTVNARYGISRIDESSKVKTLNGSQYLELAKVAYQNAGLDMKYFPFQDSDMNQYSSTSTDWNDVFFELGQNRQLNLTLQGGSNKSTFYISGGYYNEQQTIKGNKTDRYSFRTNNEIYVTDKLSTTFILSATYTVDDIFNMGRDYYEFLPIYTPYNPDGTYRLYNKIIDGKTANNEPNWTSKKFFNSVAEREQNDYRQRAFMSNANFILTYQMLEGLTLTSQLGMDYQSRFEDIYKARSNWSGMNSDGTPIGIAYRSHMNTLFITNINRFNYLKTFGKHTVSSLLGMEINSRKYRSTSSYGTGFINDHIKEVSYAIDRQGYSSADVDRAMSFFGQLTYSFDKRYFLNFNARADGNSSFGKDVRWGRFYSLGYSWNIHNEQFFNSEIIDLLKLKTSYGTNGNSRLGSQEALGIYSYGDSYNYYNEQGTVMTRTPQPTLSWETTYMANIGFRIRLFDFVDIDAEWYNNKTTNLLSKMDVSRTTGSTSITRNIGEIRNRGYEATLSFDWIKNTDLDWSTNINFSHNKNILLKLYDGIVKTVNEKLWKEGEGIDTYYLVRWAGVDPRDGAPLWYDKDGNITRTYSYDNRVTGKSSTPDLTGGFTNTVGYKNFTLSMLFNFEIGGYAFSSYARNVVSDGLNIMSQNQSVNQMDYWKEPGDMALNPKPIWGISTKSAMNSTRFLYEKTNLRLQNIALTYDMPKQYLERIGIEKASISLIGDNLGIWTRHDSKSRNSYRQLMRGFPLEEMYSVNLNLTF